MQQHFQNFRSKTPGLFQLHHKINRPARSSNQISHEKFSMKAKQPENLISVPESMTQPFFVFYHHPYFTIPGKHLQG